MPASCLGRDAGLRITSARIGVRMLGTSKQIIPFRTGGVCGTVGGTRHFLSRRGRTTTSRSISTIITLIMSGLVTSRTRDISASSVRSRIRTALTRVNGLPLTRTCGACGLTGGIGGLRRRSVRLHVRDLVGTSRDIIGRGTGGSDHIFGAVQSLATKITTGTVNLEVLPGRISGTRVGNSVRCRSLSCRPCSPVAGYILVSFRGVLHRNFGVNGTRISDPHSIGATATRVTRVFTGITSDRCNNYDTSQISRILTPCTHLGCRGRLRATGS